MPAGCLLFLKSQILDFHGRSRTIHTPEVRCKTLRYKDASFQSVRQEFARILIEIQQDTFLIPPSFSSCLVLTRRVRYPGIPVPCPKTKLSLVVPYLLSLWRRNSSNFVPQQKSILSRLISFQSGIAFSSILSQVRARFPCWLIFIPLKNGMFSSHVSGRAVPHIVSSRLVYEPGCPIPFPTTDRPPISHIPLTNGLD